MPSGYHILGASVVDDVADLGKRVSPWLWVLSVAGFGLALWDKWQINQMYAERRR